MEKKNNEVFGILSGDGGQEREGTYHLTWRETRKHKHGHKSHAVHHANTAIKPGKAAAAAAAAWGKECLSVMVAGSRQRKNLQGKVGREA